jgi:hypothetical protein
MMGSGRFIWQVPPVRPPAVPEWQKDSAGEGTGGTQSGITGKKTATAGMMVRKYRGIWSRTAHPTISRANLQIRRTFCHSPPYSSWNLSSSAREPGLRTANLFRRLPSMSDQLFQSLDVASLRRTLARFHEHVAGRHGRIELTRAGCDDVCVILSKAELESLERALEILSESAEYKTMCENLSRLAMECGACGPATDMLNP